MDLAESIDRISAAGPAVFDRFYDMFFDRVPEARAYFEGIDLQTQGSMLSVALSAVRMYPNLSENSEIYFQVLGKRHQKIEIPPEHYPVFMVTLREVVAEFHHDEWDENLADQWSGALNQVAKLMMNSAHKARG